ncbi:MAG: hypothetical protein K8953_12720, partial [Proteobacteria bacterium]|nr:hypothetical protein [Pseudomonadota bacterium]
RQGSAHWIGRGACLVFWTHAKYRLLFGVETAWLLRQSHLGRVPWGRVPLGRIGLWQRALSNVQNPALKTALESLGESVFSVSD